VFFWGCSQFIEEGVMPDLLHIVPVDDYTVFDRVLKTEDASLGLGFGANVRVFGSHTDHDSETQNSMSVTS
jgi:hypothetical protein